MVSKGIEQVLSRLLLVGVALCGTMMASGLGLLLLNRAARIPSNLQDALFSLKYLNPYALIDLGVVILIATPVARVVTSMIHFARIRDMAYVWISAYVLLVILVSTLIGFA